jgi:hypothetical protein
MLTELKSKLLFKIMIAKGKKEFANLESKLQDPMATSEALLMRMLQENADTEFGKKYNFAKIKTIEDYKKNVPFTDYDTYAELIEKMKQGEGGFITRSDPAAYAATSGSVANPKAIPVSGETIDLYKAYGSTFGIYIIDRDLKGRWKHTKALNLMEIKYKDMPCGKPYGAISGLAVNSVKHLLPGVFTSPMECVFPQAPMDTMYIHMRYALEYKKLSGIMGAFMTAISDCLNYTKNNWRLLVEDIRKGEINAEINIPPNVRESLKIKPNPKRAAELQQEFEKGFDSTIFKRIWPNLCFISAIGSGGFAPYTEKVKAMTGGIPVFHSFFAASESIMAACTQMELDHYTILPQSLFFEFIPEEHAGEENPETLTLDRLEVGKNYEIVLTNLSGFYRYRIQDVVKIMGMNNNCPQMQFAYRLKQTVSIAGEKTNDEHTRWAVTELEKATNCGIVEYSVYPDTDVEPGRYTVLLEARSEKDLENLMAQGEKVRNILEEKLCEANPSLGSKIKAGTLGKIELKYVQIFTYALYRDLMERRGISRNQIKPIRVIDTPEKAKFFFVLEHKGE